MKVVDRQDERPALAQAVQELAQAGEARRRSSCGSGISGGSRRAAATAGTLPSTGNTRARKATSVGEQAVRLAAGEPLQIPRQGVDQAVECLVGHAFARSSGPDSTTASSFRITSSRNDRMRVVLPVPVGPKMKTETVLPEWSAPKRLSRTCRCRGAADQGKRTARVRAVGELGGRPLSRAITSRPSRPPGRVAVQERDAQTDQVLRQAVHESRRRACRLGALGNQDLVGAPRKGRRPVRASNRITPTEYQSLAAVTPRPAACSGDMWPTVPTTWRSDG